MKTIMLHGIRYDLEDIVKSLALGNELVVVTRPASVLHLFEGALCAPEIGDNAVYFTTSTLLMLASLVLNVTYGSMPEVHLPHTTYWMSTVLSYSYVSRWFALSGFELEITNEPT